MSAPATQTPLDVFRTLDRDQRVHVITYLMWFYSANFARSIDQAKCSDENLEYLLESVILLYSAMDIRDYCLIVEKPDPNFLANVRKSTEMRVMKRLEQVRDGQRFEMIW